jgi:hypothetical protein
MLNNLHSGYFNIGAASRKSRGLIQSGPVALLVSKIFSEKSELFNKFFCEQSTLDDSDHTPPDLTELQTDGLRQILITETEVEDILKILDTVVTIVQC